MTYSKVSPGILFGFLGPRPPGRARVWLAALCAFNVSVASAETLNVMKTGLGDGTVSSASGAIDCGATCDATVAAGTVVTLTASTPSGSGWTFDKWQGACAHADTVPSCTLTVDRDRQVRAAFRLSPDIPPIESFSAPGIPAGPELTPEKIDAFLAANPQIDSAAHFLRALPASYRQNWILMTRSESLQTGTGRSPRVLISSPEARFVFTFALTENGSYPASHHDVVEFMQWDPGDRNFRFHEIVLDDVASPNPDYARSRCLAPDGVTRVGCVTHDDPKCGRCHSTRNVLNRSVDTARPLPGTTGVAPQPLLEQRRRFVKNKPNWDTYDSWGGMTPFNRDHVFKGSIDAAAIRRIFNPWTWRGEPWARALIEQLELQPPGVAASDRVERIGDDNAFFPSSELSKDGHVWFAFDGTVDGTPMGLPEIVDLELDPTQDGSVLGITTSYSFDGIAPAPGGTDVATTRTRNRSESVVLQHPDTPMSAEGRGVQLFDILGGADAKQVATRLDGTPFTTNFNALRVASEIDEHNFRPGSRPVDVRAAALAITKKCIQVGVGTVVQSPAAPLRTGYEAFFNTRNRVASFAELHADTRVRAEQLTRRKADIQAVTLDRSNDAYVRTLAPAAPAPGLLDAHGAATAAGIPTTPAQRLERARKEVFRRAVQSSGGDPDATVMGGIFVDREDYTVSGDYNTNLIALYRYFLEPLGVSVDKWSMGVRGRSRGYNFADIFNDRQSYEETFEIVLGDSLTARPAPGMSAANPLGCASLIGAVNDMIDGLPTATDIDIPTYTDIQRIFNKSCIECHGGLDYPPFANFGSYFDLTEEEEPTGMATRFTRAHTDITTIAVGSTVPSMTELWTRITSTTEDCRRPSDPSGSPKRQMPCGSPALSGADIQTIERWISGGAPDSVGDPHLKTVNGVNYDFQAAGEFVLLRDENFEVQARQIPVSTSRAVGPNRHTGLTSCVTVNNAAALRVGEHRITYQPFSGSEANPDAMQLRIDGEAVGFDGPEILLDGGGRVARTTAEGGVRIDVPGATSVILTPRFWSSQNLWFLFVDVKGARSIHGLLGMVGPGDWLPLLPNGDSVGAKPKTLSARYKVLYDVFGDAWRVDGDSTLFDYPAGAGPATFHIGAWPNGESPNACVAPPASEFEDPMPVPQPLLVAEAEALCAGVTADDRREDCVADVAVTGAAIFADTYLESQRIAANTPAAAPELTEPLDYATVSPDVVFTWGRAADADDRRLVYRHCVWEVTETPRIRGCGPRFTAFGGPIDLLGGIVDGSVFTGGDLNDAARPCVYVLLICVVLFLVLLIVALRRSNFWLLLLAILILAAGLFHCTLKLGDSVWGQFERSAPITLEAGNSYHWTVYVEDDDGELVQGELRRFDVE